MYTVTDLSFVAVGGFLIGVVFTYVHIAYSMLSKPIDTKES